MNELGEYLQGYLEAQNVWIAHALIKSGIPDLTALAKFQNAKPIETLVGDKLLDKSKDYKLGFADGFGHLKDSQVRLTAILEDVLGG